MHKLIRRQVVPATVEAVWAFVENPRNLNAITPAFLNFTIVSDPPSHITDGLLIEYRIRLPWMGTRRWLTEIKHVRPGKSFVDEQRVGPYRFWYHYHELTQTGQGVMIVDEVTYALPFGVIGRMVHHWIIRRMLERIFDYRCLRFSEIFTS